MRNVRHLLAGAAALVLITASVGIANAQIAGSTFEGDDGNMVANGALDWATVGGVVTGIDRPSGTGDNSFGQGTKEDNSTVTVVAGSIPPNKSDLSHFYAASQNTGSGASLKTFVYLAWERTNVLGNANMDFEINQKSTAGFGSGFTGAITINRTPGDILITYDFGGSGAPTLGFRLWQGSNWGPATAISSVNSEGAVNSGTIIDPLQSPNASMPAGTFGEASINLTALGLVSPTVCESTADIFLKSRSSSSFTSEIKDFVAPVPFVISNCGEVKVVKHTDPAGLNQNFNFTSTIPAVPSFTLNDSGTNTMDDTKVFAGSYTVTEGASPANFAPESLVCTATGGSSASRDGGTSLVKADITVVAGGSTTCTFVNQQLLGGIRVDKTSTKGGTALAGATFSVTGPNSYSTTLTTDANGTACVDHLPFGTYSVTETGAPTGYGIDDSAAHPAVVNANADCTGASTVDLPFTDTPLSQITVGFKSLVAGATSATIQCTAGVVDASPVNLPDGTLRTLGNGTVSLVPGTYTCTVVVDP